MSGSIGVGAHQREDVVGEMARRRPDLLAVEYPLVAVERAAQADVRQVAASVGFGVPLTPRVGPRQDPRQIPALLFVSAPMQQGVAEHLNTEDIVRPSRRYPSLGELFGDDHLLERRQPGAPVLGGPTRRQVSGREQRGTPFSHEGGEFVAIEGTDSTPLGGQFLGEKGLDLFAVGLGIGGVGGAHDPRLPVGRTVQEPVNR